MPATAQAPGSVTVMFAPAADGSHGVSFATADGVRATVTPAPGTTIRLNGERTSFEPVAGLLDRLDLTARVALEAAIPVGAGFGASGAATLSTAVAANAAFELGHSDERLLEASHRAEVAAGTGLGDVFVQSAGGLAYDTGAGQHRVFPDASVSYLSHDGIDTGSVLDDEATMARIETAADTAFAAFDPDAPLSELFQVAWTFAEATGLVTDRVATTVKQVNQDGGAATMAMVGETVVAAGDRLPETTQIATEGVRLLT